MKKIIISAKGTEKRAAFVANGQIVEYYVERPTKQEEIGDIYVGKVEKVVPGLDACFVQLGLMKNGFLKKEQTKGFLANPKENESISKLVCEGQYTFVQIEKESSGTKGPKVTENIELPGTYLVYMPFANYIAVSKKIDCTDEQLRLRQLGKKLCANVEGILFRTAARLASEETIIKEFTELRLLWEKIVASSKGKVERLYQPKKFYAPLMRENLLTSVAEIVVDTTELFSLLKDKLPERITCSFYKGSEELFAHFNLNAEVDKLHKRHVWLPNGASLVIDKTEALTVIDVNSTKFSRNGNKEETMLKVNEAAAIEIAKQIRKRNIGGIIIIDFLNMESNSSRARIIEVLTKECQKDNQFTQIHGFTALGLLEMTRKKDRLSISELYEERCEHCQGKGSVLSSESLYYEMEQELLSYITADEEAIWIEVPEKLLQYMKTTSSQAELEKNIRKKIYFTTTNENMYNIRHIGSCEEIVNRITRSETV